MLKSYDLKKVKLFNGEELAYRECGKGDKNLVLLHGNMSSSVHYDVLMEALEEQFHIIAIDLRGFGESSYNCEINSLLDFADDVKSLLDIIIVDRFSVLGWSTGGGVALELAALIPNRVEKVLLLDSVGIKGYPMFKKDSSYMPILTELLTDKNDIANDPIQVLPILNAYATKNKDFLRQTWNLLIYNINQPSEERYLRYLDEMVKQRNLVDVDYALVHFNMTNDFNGVNNGTGRFVNVICPILIMHGANDMVVPINYANEMMKYFNTNATLKIFENSGHAPITDEFDNFVDALVTFINT